MADNPNVGPDPVVATPNHVREKTYKAPDTPDVMENEQRKLPEKTAETNVREGMSEAVDAVRRKV